MIKRKIQSPIGLVRCLAEPTRLQILNLLASERRPLAVGEIVAAVEVGLSTASEHLRRLGGDEFRASRARRREQLVPDQRGLHRVFSLGGRACAERGAA
jgi:DNA-binding transcriptional ArsR family regulator